MLRTLIGICALGAALAATSPAAASDRTGFYGLIDRVELLPNAEAPTTAKVWGLFCVATAKFGNEVTMPTPGYLYLALVPEKEELCRNEWRDLARLAGGDECVAMGSRRNPQPRVRAASEPSARPDPHPLARGVQKVTGNRRWAALLLLRSPRPIAPVHGDELTGAVGSGVKIVLRVKNCLSQEDDTRYLFRLERADGTEARASALIKPGERETSWETWIDFQPGVEYRWTCRVVRLSDERGTYPVAAASFRLAGGKKVGDSSKPKR